MKRKYILRSSGFFLLLFAALWTFSEVFGFKYNDGITQMQKFYGLPRNSVDVLVVGSSHAFMDINPAVLYDEYGIAAFDLCGSVQPLWNSYYYIEEALKTQRPKLIVLEAYVTILGADSIDDSRIIKNIYGMKWSKTKIDAFRASVPRKRRPEFMLPYIQYHSRYKDIRQEDFLRGEADMVVYRDNKGFYSSSAKNEYNQPDVSQATVHRPMRPKSEKYYRKIIELAQREGIPIMVIVSPYPGVAGSEQEIFNTAADIAAGYGVPFLNFNLDPAMAGMDYKKDFCDVAHMNYHGSTKYSRFLGDYFKKHYSLPDRRNEKKYDTWSKEATRWKANIRRASLFDCKDMGAMGKLLADEDYMLFLHTAGTQTVDDPKLQPFFQGMGTCPEGKNGIWIFEGGKMRQHHKDRNRNVSYMTVDNHDILLEEKTHNGAAVYRVVYDKKEYKKVANGIHVMVYSKTLQDIVYAFALGKDTKYQCDSAGSFSLTPQW